MMQDQSSKQDSLFSFELYVNSLHNIAVKCWLPAVAFRLLDFPTLIIYNNNKKDATNQHDSSINALEDVEDKTFCGSRLRSCRFEKGKSSLFSMDFTKLYNLLSNIPVYTMLLDAGETKPKLLGSCSISLKHAVDELKRHVKENGYIMPANYKKNIKLNVFNLMGTVIAQLNVTYTLYSYGNSLSDHVRDSRLGGVKMYLGDNKTAVQGRANLNDDNVEQPLKSEKIAAKIRKVDAATETMEQRAEKVLEFHGFDEHKDNEISHQEQKLPVKDGNRVPSTVRSISAQQSGDAKHMSIAKFDVKNGVYCPPPLFYKPVKELDKFQFKEENVDFVKDSSKPAIEVTVGKRFDNESKSQTEEQKRVYETSVLNYDNDNVYHEILKPVENEKKGNNHVSAEKSSNTRNGNDESIQSLLQGQRQSNGHISDLITSLNSLPLLQGILKEILHFSKQCDNQILTDKQTSGIHIDQPTSPKNTETESKKHTAKENGAKDQSLTRDTGKPVSARKAMQKQGTFATKRRIPKKLKFKTTRTQEMRRALNSGSGRLEKNQQPDVKTVPLDESKKNLSQRFMFQSNENKMTFKRNKDNLPSKIDNIRYNDIHESRESTSSQNSQSKHSRESFHYDGMKSKSPHSLEIRLPSALDVREFELPIENSYQEDSNLVSSSLRQSGSNSPEPLKRKWGGNEDLSRFHGSFDARSEASRQDTTHSSSRASELEKLVSASANSRSYHTPVGSNAYDQAKQDEIPGRKSEETNGYSSDDFDDLTESLRSHTDSGDSHNDLKESSKSHRSTPTDSLNIKSRSSRLSKSSKGTGSDRSLTDANRSLKSDDYDSRVNRTNSACSLSKESRSGMSVNLAKADGRESNVSLSQSVGSERSSRSKSQRSELSVVSHNGSVKADEKWVDSLASRNSNGSELENSIKSTKSRSSLSRNSFQRKKQSDITKPVASVRSPTTSRSQRTKIQFSQQSNDDMTRSIDISNLSLNTGSEYDSIDMDELDRELQTPDTARKRGGENMAS